MKPLSSVLVAKRFWNANINIGIPSIDEQLSKEYLALVQTKRARSSFRSFIHIKSYLKQSRPTRRISLEFEKMLQREQHNMMKLKMLYALKRKNLNVLNPEIDYWNVPLRKSAELQLGRIMQIFNWEDELQRRNDKDDTIRRLNRMLDKWKVEPGTTQSEPTQSTNPMLAKSRPVNQRQRYRERNVATDFAKIRQILRDPKDRADLVAYVSQYMERKWKKLKEPQTVAEQRIAYQKAIHNFVKQRLRLKRKEWFRK